MGKFSNDMRKMATDLIKELGNRGTLTEVTRGSYDSLTGKTAETTKDYPTHSAQASRVNLGFGGDGQNTNLAGFNSERVMVAWFGKIVDATWLYDGQNITDVSEIKTQDDIIVFTFTVGEK